MNLPYPIILLAESEANVVAYILLIAGPLLALLFGYFWRKAKRTRDLMSATETCPIGQLTEGPAEIRGRTATSEEALTSPWRQQECVHYCFHVQQRRSSTNSKGHTTHRWVTYIKDEKTLPFLVKDETGQAVVDPSKIKLVVEEDRFSRSGFMNDADSDLQQLLETRYNKKTEGWMFNKTLRYTETALELNEEVYVFGDASRLGGGWVLRHGTMPLIVSDKGGAAVEKSYSTRAIVFGVLTLLCAAAGIAGIVLAVYSAMKIKELF
ncbi:MAG: hypothetical protein HN969_16400 [Verrucomicrobia bacterium]|mgnify:FL=1|jgi:hypothetical protein|nr:hypothetical protein [Verrucomicrobiota bacterium]MBT6660305.1 hypothetical protein [Verrucomicrobiota bacterium]MBT7029132.1 hypothetical protein [Verrucomicrobiota bacterium]MBT7909538.1 hypothetical protein [Verrucomicrobiota bacterium]